MHFVGADQLHGYEERVTSDMYPADFGWTPTWEEPEKIHWWFHNMLSVVEAGPYDRSLEMDYDEEVAFAAARWLNDAGRGNDERPWMLTVSLMHPHDPYLAVTADWNRYRHDDIDMPAVPYVAPEKRDPVGRRMYDLYDRGEYRVTDEHVRNARHGYYAMITYVDRLLGQVLEALRRDRPGRRHRHRLHRRPRRHAGRARPLVQDDLLRALHARAADPALRRAISRRAAWRRMCRSSICCRRFAELAGDGTFDPVEPIDGASLLGLASGNAVGWPDTVYGEYMAEGTFQPAFMIRRGKLQVRRLRRRSAAALRCRRPIRMS